jgi:hypothetical protein
MTEADWLTCTRPGLMLRGVPGALSDRKLRLLACGCCRRIPGFVNSEPDMQGLELTERDVDGQASEEEFAELGEDGWDIRWYRRDGVDALNRALESYWGSIWDSRQRFYSSQEEQFRASGEVDVDLANLVREIIGNPFRDVTVDPTWLTWNDRTVLRLAQTIYDQRAYDRMPILADALEDAGCDNADILNHCREPGEHVRGCWVLDLLLGKK